MIYTNLSMQYRYDYLHSDWPPDGKLCLLLVVTSGKPGRPAQTDQQPASEIPHLFNAAFEDRK